MATALLATTYFGPVQWYQKLNRSEACLIDAHESFQKQTYRNRCIIATPSGPQALTVPVERASDGDEGIRHIRISDHGNWRHQHWNALCSAYGESPFFDYYADDLRPMFEKRWEFLFDMNLDITRLMCQLLDIEPSLQLTESYLQHRNSCRGLSRRDSPKTCADRRSVPAPTLLAGVRTSHGIPAQPLGARPAVLPRP